MEQLFVSSVSYCCPKAWNACVCFSAVLGRTPFHLRNSPNQSVYFSSPFVLLYPLVTILPQFPHLNPTCFLPSDFCSRHLKNPLSSRTFVALSYLNVTLPSRRVFVYLVVVSLQLFECNARPAASFMSQLVFGVSLWPILRPLDKIITLFVPTVSDLARTDIT